jgi:hypothetical protein
MSKYKVVLSTQESQEDLEFDNLQKITEYLNGLTNRTLYIDGVAIEEGEAISEDLIKNAEYILVGESMLGG